MEEREWRKAAFLVHPSYSTAWVVKHGDGEIRSELVWNLPLLFAV